MTDAHFHRGGFPAFLRTPDREVRFYGIHPWQADEPSDISAVRARLVADPTSGVGEIGLDRLKSKVISDSQRKIFEQQLALAAELRRPVVLHGAKCWGQVVAAVKRMIGGGLAMGDKRQAFLFHGFSRSDGLIPEIVELNGFISVGPAVLNDHAVNYRALVKKIPLDRLLVETDAVVGARVPTRPHIREVLEKTAEILGVSSAELERITDENADRFLGVV